MRRAVKMWDTATYWTDRAAGAIRNAKHKERPDVRARRIKTIEADKRKRERTIAESTKYRKAWAAEGLTDGQAQQIANFDHLSFSFPVAKYPASTYEGPRSLWSALDSKVIDADKAAQLAVSAHARIIAHCSRWVAHYENRIVYERAMLAEDGGTLADQNKPEKGGACRCWASPREGWSYIQKVNRVTVSVLHNYSDGGRAFSLTVPFDKLTGIMSAAAVEQKRRAGLLIESDKGTGIGFRLASAPAPPTEDLDPEDERKAEAEAKDHDQGEETAPPCAACHRPWSAHATHPATTCGCYWSADEWAKEQARVSPRNMGDEIEAMRQTLKTGLFVVSAPQLFPTPATLAARMVELAQIEPGQQVLEPSAGTGVLCQAIKAAQPAACVFAVEINHQLCEMLSQLISTPEGTAEGISRNVLKGDFLECFGLGMFDRIVMNPPFADGADINHITHALRLLRPGGRIVALCANGPRQTAKLRPMIEGMGGAWEELPAGTFAAAGTSVRTVLLTASQPE